MKSEVGTEIEVIHVTTRKRLNEVRILLHAFDDWQRQRYKDDIAIVDRYFDNKTFAAELASLPGKYAPPKGCILLALKHEQPAGCVALREIDENICEMKAMFVHPQFHGRGIGRLLAEGIILVARSIGYSHMRLNTGPRQVEALGLYSSLGFREIRPYYDLPEALKTWLLFMELIL